MIAFWLSKKNRGWTRITAVILAVSFLFTLVATPYAQAPAAYLGSVSHSVPNSVMEQYFRKLEGLRRDSTDVESKKNLESILNLLKNNLFFAGPVKKDGKNYLLFTYWNGMDSVPFVLEFNEGAKNGDISAPEFENAVKTALWKLRNLDKLSTDQKGLLPVALRMVSSLWFAPAQFQALYANDPNKVKEIFGSHPALLPLYSNRSWDGMAFFHSLKEWQIVSLAMAVGALAWVWIKSLISRRGALNLFHWSLVKTNLFRLVPAQILVRGVVYEKVCGAIRAFIPYLAEKDFGIYIKAESVLDAIDELYLRRGPEPVIELLSETILNTNEKLDVRIAAARYLLSYLEPAILSKKLLQTAQIHGKWLLTKIARMDYKKSDRLGTFLLGMVLLRNWYFISSLTVKVLQIDSNHDYFVQGSNMVSDTFLYADSSSTKLILSLMSIAGACSRDFDAIFGSQTVSTLLLAVGIKNILLNKVREIRHSQEEVDPKVILEAKELCYWLISFRDEMLNYIFFSDLEESLAEEIRISVEEINKEYQLLPSFVDEKDDDYPFSSFTISSLVFWAGSLFLSLHGFPPLLSMDIVDGGDSISTIQKYRLHQSSRGLTDIILTTSDSITVDRAMEALTYILTLKGMDPQKYIDAAKGMLRIAKEKPYLITQAHLRNLENLGEKEVGTYLPQIQFNAQKIKKVLVKQSVQNKAPLGFILSPVVQKKHSNDDENYWKRAVHSDPVWETILFQFIGFIVMNLGWMYGDSVLMVTGWLWGTAVYSFSHILVRWIVLATDRLKDFFTDVRWNGSPIFSTVAVRNHRFITQPLTLTDLKELNIYNAPEPFNLGQDLKDFFGLFLLGNLFVVPYLGAFFSPPFALLSTLFASKLHSRFNQAKRDGSLPQFLKWIALGSLSSRARGTKASQLEELKRDKALVDKAMEDYNRSQTEKIRGIHKTPKNPTNFEELIEFLKQRVHYALPNIQMMLDISIKTENYSFYLNYKKLMNRYLPYFSWASLLKKITVNKMTQFSKSGQPAPDAMEDLLERLDRFLVLPFVRPRLDGVVRLEQKPEEMNLDQWDDYNVEMDQREMDLAKDNSDWSTLKEGIKRGDYKFFVKLAEEIYSDKEDIKYSSGLAQYLMDWGGNENAIFAALIYRLWQRKLSQEEGAEERLNNAKKILDVHGKKYQDVERILTRLEVILKIPYRPKRKGREDIVNNQLKLIIEAAAGQNPKSGEDYSQTLLPQVLLLAFGDRLVQLEERPGEGRFHSELQMQVRHLYAPLADMVNREGIALKLWEAIEINQYGEESYRAWKKNFKFEKFGFLRDHVKEWLDSRGISYTSVSMRPKHPISGKYKLLRKGPPKNREEGDLVSDGVSITVVLPDQSSVDQCWGKDKYDVEYAPDPDDPLILQTWKSQMNPTVPHVGQVINGGRKNGAQIWTVEENIKKNFRYLHLTSSGIEIKIVTEADWKEMNKGDTPHWVYKLNKNLELWREFKTRQKFQFKPVDLTHDFMENCKRVYQSLQQDGSKEYVLQYDEEDGTISPLIFVKGGVPKDGQFTPIVLSQPGTNLTSKLKSSLRALNAKILTLRERGTLKLTQEELGGIITLDIEVPHNTPGILETILLHARHMGDISFVRVHSIEKGKKGEIRVVLTDTGKSTAAKKKKLEHIRNILTSSEDVRQFHQWDSTRTEKLEIIGKRDPDLELEIAEKLNWFNIVDLRTKNIGEEGWKELLEDAKSAMGLSDPSEVKEGDFIGYSLRVQVPEDVTFEDLESLLNSHMVMVLPSQNSNGRKDIPSVDKSSLIRKALKLDLPKNGTVLGVVIEVAANPTPKSEVAARSKNVRTKTGPLGNKKSTGPLHSPQDAARKSSRTVDLVLEGEPSHAPALLGAMKALQSQGFNLKSVRIGEKVLKHPNLEDKELVNIIQNSLANEVSEQILSIILGMIPMVGEKPRGQLFLALQYIVSLLLPFVEEKTPSIRVGTEPSLNVNINLEEDVKGKRIQYEKKLLGQGDPSAIQFFLELLKEGIQAKDFVAIQFLDRLGIELGEALSFVGNEPYRGMEFSADFYISSSWAKGEVFNLLLERIEKNLQTLMKGKKITVHPWERDAKENWWKTLLPSTEGAITYVVEVKGESLKLGALTSEGWVGKLSEVNLIELDQEVARELKIERKYRSNVATTLRESKLYDKMVRAIMRHCDAGGSGKKNRIERSEVKQLAIVFDGALDDSSILFKDRILTALQKNEVFKSLELKNIRVYPLLKLEAKGYLVGKTLPYGVFLHLGSGVEGTIIGKEIKSRPSFIGEISTRVIRTKKGHYEYRGGNEDKIDPEVVQGEQSLSRWMDPEAIADRYYETLVAEGLGFSAHLHNGSGLNHAIRILGWFNSGKMTGNFGKILRSVINQVIHEGKKEGSFTKEPGVKYTPEDLAEIHEREPKILPALLSTILKPYLREKRVDWQDLSVELQAVVYELQEALSQQLTQNFQNLGVYRKEDNRVKVYAYQEELLVDNLHEYILADFGITNGVAELDVDVELLEELAESSWEIRRNGILALAMREGMFLTLLQAGVTYDEAHELILNSEDPKSDMEFIKDLTSQGVGMNVDKARRVLNEFRASQQRRFFEFAKMHAAEFKRFYYKYNEWEKDFKFIMNLDGYIQAGGDKTFLKDKWNGEFPNDFYNYLYYLTDKILNETDELKQELYRDEWQRIRNLVDLMGSDDYLQYKSALVGSLSFLQYMPMVRENILLMHVADMKSGVPLTLKLLVSSLIENIFSQMKSIAKELGLTGWGNEDEGPSNFTLGIVLFLLLGPLASGAWGADFGSLKIPRTLPAVSAFIPWAIWFVPFIFSREITTTLKGAQRWFSVDWWVVPVSSALVGPIEFAQHFISRKSEGIGLAASFTELPVSQEEEVASTIGAIGRYTDLSYGDFKALDQSNPLAAELMPSYGDIALETQELVSKETKSIQKGALLLVDLNDFVELKKEEGTGKLSVDYIPAVTEVIGSVKRALGQRKDSSLALSWESGLNSAQHAKLVKEVLNRLNLDQEKTVLFRSPAEILPYVQGGREVRVFTLNGSRWSQFINEAQLIVLESLKQRIQIQDQSRDWLKFQKLFSLSM